jgi:hypothetical protein
MTRKHCGVKYFHIGGLALLLASMIAGGPARAALVPISSSTDGFWVGSPQSKTVPTPSVYTSAEGNFGSIGLGQTFKALSGGALANLQIYQSGGAGTYDLHLYDQGTTNPGLSYTTTTDLVPAGLQLQVACVIELASMVERIAISRWPRPPCPSRAPYCYWGQRRLLLWRFADV